MSLWKTQNMSSTYLQYILGSGCLWNKSVPNSLTNQLANKGARSDLICNQSICWCTCPLKMNIFCEQVLIKFFNTVLVSFHFSKTEELFLAYTTSVTISIVSSSGTLVYRILMLKVIHLFFVFGLIFFRFSINSILEFTLHC